MATQDPLSSSPPRGMRDFLPEQVADREAVTSTILRTYLAHGFQRIETPCVESIRLLSRGEGGENEKLIFKILKRGEKLPTHGPISEAALVDLGLRFDLTLPLARYYANNQASLPSPFKAAQVGPVWRAERPQQGRYRQFVQCDIDIIGEPSWLAEVDLLDAGTSALLALGLSGFTLRVNDREVLAALAGASGFSAAELDSVLITLDKRDKLGWDGVRAELAAKGHDPVAAERLLRAVQEALEESRGGASLPQSLARLPIAEAALSGLEAILAAIGKRSEGRFEVRFDPTVVRGMGYYTGPIFEVSYPGWPSSIAGGGRYDAMLAKLGRAAPACGFSLGFERIITLLEQEGLLARQHVERFALLVDVEQHAVTDALAVADRLRSPSRQVSVLARKRKLGLQLNRLAASGFTHYAVYHPGEPLEARVLRFLARAAGQDRAAAARG